MIIKCRECGNDVSDKAQACPHCGIAIIQKNERKPVKKYPKLRTAIIATSVFTLFLTSFLVPLIWFIVMCFVCSSIDGQKYDKSWVISLRNQCGIVAVILWGIATVLFAFIYM